MSAELNAMARQAGLPMSWLDKGVASAWPELERFAELVRVDERAALASQATPPAPVGGGWQVVPVEPTPHMLCLASDVDGQSSKMSRAIWRAMLEGAASSHLAACAGGGAKVPLTDEDMQILDAVRREMDEDDSGNAPGHAHEIPGIWDLDNGTIAGMPCAWCLTWQKFTALIAEHEAPRPDEATGQIKSILSASAKEGDK